MAADFTDGSSEEELVEMFFQILFLWVSLAGPHAENCLDEQSCEAKSPKATCTDPFKPKLASTTDFIFLFFF